MPTILPAWIQDEIKSYSDAPGYEIRLISELNWTESQIQSLITRRKQGEPLSKIIGEKGFYKYVFQTNKDVLDPRPDSETLVESVLKYCPVSSNPHNILDIGTGSGCLLISLVNEYHNRGLGIDISDKALQTAKLNAQHLAQNEQITFHKCDFMQADWTQDLPQFDIIISNPPYIKTPDIEHLDVAVKQYDPMLALDGGADGLDAYRQLSKTLMPILSPQGKIFFEIGQGQEQDVIGLMADFGFACLDQIKDLSGIIRVLVFCKV